MSRYKAWGYTPPSLQAALRPNWRQSVFPEAGGENEYLPFGNGRSYGDSCLNSNGVLLDSQSLDNVLSFDRSSGLIRCEAGVLFSDLLNIIVPQGWFLPVTPGTSFVTVGGALANDVHGKNHHRDGCFGNHVLAFELCRSDGSRTVCTAATAPELFSATIGGLGLTGFVSWVEFQLAAVSGPDMDVDAQVFYGLDEFSALSNESHHSHQYTVAWLDCVASGKNFGRGIFIRANHSASLASTGAKKGSLSVPVNFPPWALNAFTVRCFNELYFHKHRLLSTGASTQHYGGYFYPLDSVKNWNKIYGRKGFYQYQFVVPDDNSEALVDVLQRIVKSGQGSFLAVLKRFGNVESPGMLSFPKQGLCLALDFPNRSDKTLALLNELDQVVMEAQGCVYPAKDNRMSSEAFQCYFPGVGSFTQHVDPAFSSDFWRRVSD